MSYQIDCSKLRWLASCRVTNLRICGLKISASFMINNLIRDRHWVGLTFMFSNHFLEYFFAQLSVLMIELRRNPRMWQFLSIAHLWGSQTFLKTSDRTLRWIALWWFLTYHNKTVRSLMIPQNVRCYWSLVLQKMCGSF